MPGEDCDCDQLEALVANQNLTINGQGNIIDNLITFVEELEARIAELEAYINEQIRYSNIQNNIRMGIASDPDSARGYTSHEFVTAPTLPAMQLEAPFNSQGVKLGSTFIRVNGPLSRQ